MSDRFSYETFDGNNNRIDSGKFFVDLTEYGVQNWPDGMEGCRLFRIEYGGVNEGCVYEGSIWMPPTFDRDRLEEFLQAMFRDWNEEDYREDNPDSVWLPPAAQQEQEDE